MLPDMDLDSLDGDAADLKADSFQRQVAAEYQKSRRAYGFGPGGGGGSSSSSSRGVMGRAAAAFDGGDGNRRDESHASSSSGPTFDINSSSTTTGSNSNSYGADGAAEKLLDASGGRLGQLIDGSKGGYYEAEEGDSSSNENSLLGVQIGARADP